MTVTLQAGLVAERVTMRGRVPLEAVVDLESETGRVCELTIPDGSVNMPVLALTETAGLWLCTDAALQVTLGTPESNAAISLLPGGMVAWLGASGDVVVYVTYTAGTGMSAHLMCGGLAGFLVALPAPPPILPPLPITLSVTEGYESIDVETVIPQYYEPWEA